MLNRKEILRALKPGTIVTMTTIVKECEVTKKQLACKMMFIGEPAMVMTHTNHYRIKLKSNGGEEFWTAYRNITHPALEVYEQL